MMLVTEWAMHKLVKNWVDSIKMTIFIFKYKLFLIDVPPGLSVSFAFTTGKELLKKSPNFPILRKSRRQTAGRRTKHHLHHSRLEYIHIITFLGSKARWEIEIFGTMRPNTTQGARTAYFTTW